MWIGRYAVGWSDMPVVSPLTPATFFTRFEQITKSRIGTTSLVTGYFVQGGVPCDGPRRGRPHSLLPVQMPLRCPRKEPRRGILTYMVGTVGFEPTTPSVSRKCSPPELSAHVCDQRSVGYCTDPWPYAPVLKYDPRRARSSACAAVGASLSYPLRFGACGRGSVGRAQPCQGWGRRFESGRPLHRSPANGRDR